MTQIRKMIVNLTEGEQRGLFARSSAAASGGRSLIAVNLIGLALIVGLGAISVRVIRRLAEEEFAYMADLERSNQELDDFAHIASHDLEEPS